MLRNNHLQQIYKLALLLFFTVLLSCSSTIAQELVNEQLPESGENLPQAIAINDISTESEKLGQRISQLRYILQPSVKIKEVDSLLNNVSVEIKLKKDSFLLITDDMPQRILKVSMVEWGNYKSNLKQYQSVLKSRLDNLTSTNIELVEEVKRWELTRANLSRDNELDKVYSNLDTAITTLQEIVQISLIRLDDIFVIQKGLTSLILEVDEVISEINRMELQLQKDYFVFDSPVLWQYSKIDSIATDTTGANAISALHPLQFGFKENVSQLKLFLNERQKTFLLQIGFILLLLVLMFVVRRKWKKDINQLDNLVKKEVKTVLQHPILATLTIGLLISYFFYKSAIPFFGEIHVTIILATTTFLLPKLTSKKFIVFLFLLYVAFIMSLLETHLNPELFLVRIILLFKTIVLIVALFYGRREMRNNPEHFLQIKGLFKFVVPFFILFLFIAAIANLIGMVSLSRFLSTATMYSTILGFVTYLSIIVFASVLVILFKLKSSGNIQTLTTLVDVTQKRIKPILLFTGLIVWILFTLMNFEISEYMREYIKEILQINWNVGEMVISVGGILSFSTIFIAALVIAKLGATIFQDEWVIKTLPRGIAPAISLLLRIFVISIGLYVGLSAAGLDLSRLGFIIGALGVGIGFGLQTVVLNFIAGLILAFERPINLGDTIIVDQEMGVVTNIGVRSSNIRTYSGAEAIIPNGNLISKKVLNWTLTNRDRRSKIAMKTSKSANPNLIIELFKRMASENPKVYTNPAPICHFLGYDPEGNLDFKLYFWTTFDDTWNTEPQIALEIYNELEKEGIHAPIPTRRIISEEQS